MATMHQNSFYKDAVETFKKFYSSNECHVPTISEEQQHRELENLKLTIPYERFFFVVHLDSNIRISDVAGVSRYLGYDENSFDFKRYVEIIHPSHRNMLLSLSQATLELANSYKQLGFMKQKYIVNLKILHANGSYHEVSRCLTPFQISSKGKIMAYLNLFTLLNEVKNDIEPKPLNPQIKEENVYKKSHELELQTINEKFCNIGFSFRERQVLTCLAYSDTDSVSFTKIGEALGLKKSSVETLLLRAKDKLEEYYGGQRFSSIRQMGTFVRNERIV